MKEKNIKKAIKYLEEDYIIKFIDDEEQPYIALKYENKGYGCIYWYNDDRYTAYISSLRVMEEYRSQGIGKKIFEDLEHAAELLDVDIITLKVRKDSWVHDWYERIGYEEFVDDHDDDSFIWMNKIIEKEKSQK